VSGNARRPHVKAGRPSIKGPALTERNAGRNLNKFAHLRISPRTLNVEVRGSRQFDTSRRHTWRKPVRSRHIAQFPVGYR